MVRLNEDIDELKKRFAALNAYVMANQGFMTSIPCDSEMRFECLPTSILPDKLDKLGWRIELTGTTQRITNGNITTVDQYDIHAHQRKTAAKTIP